MMKIFGQCRKESGFTIIELMVALGVFATIITIVTTIFVGTLRDARFVSAQAAAVDNAGLVMEQVAREVRTGSNFAIPGGYDSRLMFTNYHGENVIYSFQNNRINKQVNGGTVMPLTSQNTVISGGFYITQPANTTPRITMVAMVKDENGRPLANLQTTVSARLIYYKAPNP